MLPDLGATGKLTKRSGLSSPGCGATPAQKHDLSEVSTRLKRMLNPRKVAWFGGGGIAPAVEYMRANKFSGEAVAVNPRHAKIAGLPCVPSAAELPFLPDLAVLVIPKEVVNETVELLSKAGCGGVICITSGFSESEGGSDRQNAMVAAAGEMPVIGPNCPGIANFLDGNAFMMDHFGDHGSERGVAVISNGGAYLSDLGCADRSQPIAYMFGLGNQAMVSVADALDVLLDDPRVTAVNIYFEGINDMAKLSHAAAKAARKGVPVVAVKGGRSEAGSQAAKLHTASLSGDAEIASALFRRFGWIEAMTPSEAIETVKMLSFTPIPKGNRAGFITSSGSYAVLGGDIAEKVGLQMDPPSDSTKPVIQDTLPDYVGPTNPLDIADAHSWPLEDQLPIYRAFAENDYDLFVQVMCYPPKDGWDMTTWDATTSALAEAKGGRPAAFVNTLAESLPRAVRDRMIANRMAPLQGMEDGLRAVAHAGRYGALREQLVPEAMLLDGKDAVPDKAGKPLNEAAVKGWLAQEGLDVPRQWVIDNTEEMPDIPCSCALKAMVPSLQHKSEAGAVSLNIAPQDLPGAIRSMKKRLTDQGLESEGFLVEEMIENPIAELLVGLRRVPEIGLTLTLAIGGVAVELMRDTTTVILPAGRKEIEAAIRSLKLAPLILGYRNRPSADLVVVLDAIDALCDFAAANICVAELEVNPLLLTETRAVVVDAVLTQSGKGIP